MVNGHGGKRTGAGRRKGALTKKTQEIAAQASSEGVTPLEVMLENMRFAHHKADALLAKLSGDDTIGVDEFKQLLGLRELAEECAKDAAPYMHPRLQAIQHMGEGGGPVEIKRIEWVAVDPADRVSEGIPPPPARKALSRG